MRSTVTALVLLLSLTGCAAEQPQLVTEPGVSLSGYKSLAVAPAANETGQKFDFDFVGVFTEDLKSALMSKGYDLSDSNASPPELLSWSAAL